ncbi:MAG: S9 family peptidase [Alphaproteobacteria bacterium]|nr:S9 family peptidase [Alphaproteobacteria bacterium]
MADLIPPEAYLQPPVERAVAVSPSGDTLAWFDPSIGVLRSAPTDAPDRAKTLADLDDVPMGLWGLSSGWLVQSQVAPEGHTLARVDENGVVHPVASGPWLEVFAVRQDRVAFGVYRDRPGPGRTELRAPTDPDISEELVVYAKEPQLDVRVLDLATGRTTSVWSGRRLDRVSFDDELRPVAGERYGWTPQWFDGRRVFTRTSDTVVRIRPDGRTRQVATIWSGSDRVEVVRATPDRVDVFEPVGGRPALVSYGSGHARVVLQGPGPDLVAADVDADGVVHAVATADARRTWWIDDLAAKQAIDAMTEASAADVTKWWRAGARTFAWMWGPTEPSGLWVHEPETGTRRLLPSYGLWDAIAWRPTEAMSLTARDGLTLTAYLTRPDEVIAGPPPWPLVLTVHGGPWGVRDTYGWNPEHQRLADLGYAVMSVNYRGSGGFGQAFEDASARQWGLAMQDDLLDGVAWAIAQGVADPARLAITGSSYGGYATLQALTTAPDVFACGAAGLAPAVLFGPDRPEATDDTDSRDIPIGGHALRVAASPLTHVAALRRPLLVWNGELDEQVPIRSARRFAEEADARGARVTFVVYPEAHHRLNGRDERAQEVITARFLALCLGGRAEPWSSLGAAGGNLRVELGAEHLPGLATAAVGLTPSEIAR